MTQHYDWRMNLSIRTRVLLAMNLLAIGLALLFGWLAGRVAADVVEDRLARALLRNTRAFLHERRLPANDSVMRDLRRIFGVELAVWQRDGTGLAATSRPENRAELALALAAQPMAGRLEFRGERYRVAEVELAESAPGRWLVAMVPEALVAGARADAFRRTVWFIAPVIGVASLLATLLSLTITRPLRRLANEMDALAAGAGAGGVAGTAVPPPPARGPVEAQRLAASFHHLLAELRHAQSRLDQASRLAALGRLAATTAHELKNPLSGIQMNLRVLEDELARHGLTDPSVDVIRNEIERMDLHLQELMLVARAPAAGMVAGAMSPLDLASVADSVLKLMAARCGHAAIRIVRDISPAPPVRGYAPHLRQLFMNLVVNALDAMPGGGTLTVRVAPAAAGGVDAEVCDTGPGLAPASGDIFAPLVTTKPTGAGLGLFICRQIMTEHGGDIRCDSRPAGCRFRFHLPPGTRST